MKSFLHTGKMINGTDMHSSGKDNFRVFEWILFSHLEIQYCGFKPSENSYKVPHIPF